MPQLDSGQWMIIIVLAMLFIYWTIQNVLQLIDNRTRAKLIDKGIELKDDDDDES